MTVTTPTSRTTAAARHPGVPVARPGVPARLRSVRPLPVLLAAAAVALLPVTAATVDLGPIGGLGLAGVLPATGWAAIVLAVLAATTELASAAPRARVLGGLTAVLALCTTGMASVVESGARMSVAWLHLGFVDAVADGGTVPTAVDSRFSWAGFFAQWAWYRDASGLGSPGLDAVLRWTPPVTALLWATAVLVIARRLLGPGRTPWLAAWLFLGLNWIEQDYFSPQATAMLLVGVVWVLALGPLATSRPPLTDPSAPVVSRPRAVLRSAARRPARLRSPHPVTPPAVVLAAWAVITLCLVALAVSHQLTPIALLVQLAVLTVAGRLWGGRGLVVVLAVATLTWIVLGGQEFWVNQLALATSDVGDAGGSVTASLADRLVGGPYQLAVKTGRIGLALGTVALAALGAWARYRRTGEVVWFPLALAPAALVLVQSYGGEMFLRVLLYGLPFFAVLGARALRGLLPAGGPRAAVDRRGRTVRAGALTLGLVALFAALVTVRGGNDAYVSVPAADVALARAVVGGAAPGSTVLPLSRVTPNLVDRVGEVGQVPQACEELADDPVRCALADRPAAIWSTPRVDAEGVYLRGQAPGWSRVAMLAIEATGRYRLTHDGGLALVLTRTTPPGTA